MLESAPMKLPSSKTFFTRDQIQEAVGRLAASVNRWITAEGARELNLIPILEGAGPLTRDLTGKIQDVRPDLKVQAHFLRSRGTEGNALREGREIEDGGLDWESLRDRPVLILDDLLDSGKTLRAVQERAAARGLVDFKSAVLIRKYADSSARVDFRGFELDLDRAALSARGLKDYWLFGYGMDWDGNFRELDHVQGVEVR